MGAFLGLLVVAVLLVVVLSDREPRLTGSNSDVRLSGRSLEVVAGAQRCQRDVLPAGTGAVRVFLGLRGDSGGPVRVTLERADGTTARTGIPRRTEPGTVEVAVEPTVAEENAEARICFTNRGEDTIEFAGDRTPFLGGGANATSALLDDDIRVDFLRPAEETWWSLAPRVAERFGVAKTSFSGPWLFWVVLGVVLLVAIATVMLLSRTLRSR